MMANKFIIRRITRFDRRGRADINKLLLQLSSRGYQVGPLQLKETLKNKQAYVFGLYDQKNIVGTVTLIALRQITGYKGYVEDVVVDEKYRGRGLGEKLMLHIMLFAKKLHLDSLELKSETYRIAANALYKKLGFATKEANVYTMKLEVLRKRRHSPAKVNGLLAGN